jgi:hypothetical protein
VKELLDELVDCLSFDRPASFERMVREARDLMLVHDHPVGNDTRDKASVQRSTACGERS